MKLEHIVFIGLVVVLSLSASAQNIGLDMVGTTNVVATIASYKVNKAITNDIVVPVFTDNCPPEQVEGILFYIVAPTNYAGKYFYLEGENFYSEGEILLSSLGARYEKGKFYRFDFNDKEYYVNIQPQDLVSFPLDESRIHYNWKSAGRLHYRTIQEVKDCIVDINREIGLRQKGLKQAEIKLEEERLKLGNKPLQDIPRSQKREYLKRDEDVWRIKGDIAYLEAKKKDAIRQAEQMKDYLENTPQDEQEKRTIRFALKPKKTWWNRDNDD